MALLCPKCMNPMRQYERNRVVVDQCVECGGLFLDRGELEHLVQAECTYYGEPAAVAASAPGALYEERGYDRQRFDDDHDDRRFQDYLRDERRYDDRSYGKGSKARKARSFLEELFD